MFADQITQSMKAAIDETERRRQKQLAYNQEHGITPKTIKKQIVDLREMAGFRTELSVYVPPEGERMSDEELESTLKTLKKQMLEAAKDLNFEKAADLRDKIRGLEATYLGIGEAPAPRAGRSSRRRGGRRSNRP